MLAVVGVLAEARDGGDVQAGVSELMYSHGRKAVMIEDARVVCALRTCLARREAGVLSGLGVTTKGQRLPW